MAKKKHGKRRHHRHVGAMSLHHSSPLVTLGSVAVGYLLADTVNPLVDKVIPSSIFPAPAAGASPTALGLNENTAAMGVELGIGGYLLLSKTKKSLLKTAAGGILAGAGLKRALKATGIVTGYQSVPVVGRHRMAGYQKVPVVGKTPSQLQGVPAQLEGFRVNGYVPTGSNKKVMGKVSGLYGDATCGQSSGSGVTSTSGSGCMN